MHGCKQAGRREKGKQKNTSYRSFPCCVALSCIVYTLLKYVLWKMFSLWYSFTELLCLFQCFRFDWSEPIVVFTLFLHLSFVSSSYIVHNLLKIQLYAYYAFSDFWAVLMLMTMKNIPLRAQIIRFLFSARDSQIHKYVLMIYFLYSSMKPFFT